MQPIDYTRGFQPVDIAGSIASGFNVGSGIQNELQRRQDDAIARQQAEQQQIQQMQRQAQYERALFDTFNDPTPQNLARLQIQFPERVKEFQTGFDTLDKARVDDEKKFIGQLYASMRSDPEVSKKLLTDRITALEAGKEDASEEKAALAMLESDPKRALGYVGSLAAFTLPKEQIEALTKLGGEERAAALAPAELAAKEAEAVTKRAEAAITPAKLAAELNLTKAQATKLAVETRALSEEAKRAAAQFTAGPTPEKAFDFEQKLRNEYNTQTKEFQEVRSAATRVNAAEQSAAGDLALIFSFMKALDPGSVVRETEFANAQNASGVDTKIRNIYNRVLTGERLTEGQRKQFKDQALSLAKAAETREKEVRKGIERVVTSYKLNPQNVFYTEQTPEVPPPGAPPAAPSGPIVVDY